MATTIQSLPGTERVEEWRTGEGVRLFGIRHLSAAGAWHLKRYLQQVQPELVLIEGPADTTELISDLVRPGVRPPVAVLCYTSEAPVHSIVYPYAEYSPEYQAIIWADKNRKECRFIDLPSSVKSPLYRLQELERMEFRTRQEEALAGEHQEDLKAGVNNRIQYHRYAGSLYRKIAGLGGEEDYDTYWERCFEHNLETDAYLRSVSLHSGAMRELTDGWEQEADPLALTINILREAYMKRCIREALEQGVEADQIVVITGAYHVKGLMSNEPMSDEELQALPCVETKMTLMPYSYYKLSSFSGYGAGNHAPFYYELMWQAMEEGRLHSLPMQYLAELSGHIREKQGYSSTATVIEAVRLAQALQYLHGGTLPTLKDLHDSAVATLGGGQLAVLAESFAALDVGTRIGELPDGVSQTPIQDDMNRQLKRLKLEKYKSVVAQDLALDLRENRKVKSREAAFLDLERSTFLHRLAFLDIRFARYTARRQESSSWAEGWVLCWTPEVEIQVVESVLYGETIEAAASYLLKERLNGCKDVLEVAMLVKQACECRLGAVLYEAIRTLQSFAAEAENFSGVAGAARELSFLIQYGSLRQFEPEPLIPILQQLFLKGSLILYPACACNEEAARRIAGDMTMMHMITQEQYELINDEIWLKQLEKLARADDRNPVLSGFACSILMERGRLPEADLMLEVSRHLSPGNTPEAGAGWFEGLSRRNRYVLLSRTALWTLLDEYLTELDDESFKRALICLRRAFSNFEAHEKNGICEILAELWGIDAGNVAELLQGELSSEVLDELNDFDFGDLL